MKLFPKSHNSQVYISYARKDQGFAEELYEHLKTLNWNPYLDIYNLKPGDNWPLSLTNAQNSSVSTIVLISKKTSKSHYVLDEIARAIELGKVSTHILIPVPISDKVAMQDYPFGLTTIQSLKSKTNPVNVAQAINECLSKEFPFNSNSQIDLSKALRTRSILIALSPIVFLLIAGLLTTNLLDVFAALPSEGEPGTRINIGSSYGPWYTLGLFYIPVIVIIVAAIRFSLRIKKLSAADGLCLVSFAILAPFSLWNFANNDSLVPLWVQALLDVIQVPLGIIVVIYLVHLKGKTVITRTLSFLMASVVAVLWVAIPFAFLLIWLASSDLFNWIGSSPLSFDLIFDPGIMSMIAVIFTSGYWIIVNRSFSNTLSIPR